MDFPSAFKERIQGQLPQEADLLFTALSEEAPTSIRLNPFKPFSKLPDLEATPWNGQGRYLKERPSFTLDPAFHAGMYYVQEASSMSIEYALKQLDLTNALALDLCGAPGGKSTLLATHLYPKGGMVLANEVIRARAQTLKENCIKWGLPNMAVSNLDPKHFAKSKVLFDLILVDAPCSGEGMFRKDEAARNEWSTEHVSMCAARQKRILSDILPNLKAGGYLLYSTCTFSEEENEENLNWLAQEHELQSLLINFPEEWNIIPKEKNGVIGYAFYPHKTKGEGFFIALLKKSETPDEAQAETPRKKDKKQTSNSLGKKTDANCHAWLNEDVKLFEWFDGVYAVPARLEEMASKLFNGFPLQYLGTKVAELAGRDWKPSAELAFSVIANPEAFPSVTLGIEDALHFLRRDELKFPDSPQGWLRLDYMNQGLGFVKNLGNRSNSQYPKEWRILMQIAEIAPSWHQTS